MLAAWAVPIGCGAVWQLATSGITSDLGVSAGWVGGFTLLAWAMGVAPLRRWLEDAPFFSDWRWSWLGWAVLAMVIYSVSVPFFLGVDAFLILWYPATMGCIAGFVFALLRRKDGSPES